VTVNALSAPASTVMAGGPTTFCSGDSVILSAAGGAAAFLWSPNGETTAAVTATASASYQVQVTGSNGCTASSSPVAVTANKNPQAFISANGSLLFVQGDSVVLTATQAAAYAWSPGGQTTASITVYASGTFQVVITDANGCTGMSAPATTFVSQSTSPAIAVSGPTTFCDGGSVVLTAPAGTGYQWSTGATGSSITVQSSGLYAVTVYTGTGSFNPQPVQVTVNPVPSATITAGGPTSFCSGGSVVLQANAANSWLWLPGGETTQSITVTSPGTYTVRTTNMYGCTALSAPVAVSWSTSCPCPVPTGLFNSNISASQATLNWAPVAGADSLQVFLFRIFPSRKTTFLPPFAGTFTQVTVGVLPNAWYYWKVRALCSGSWGNWSAHEWLSTPALKASAGPVRQDDGGATEGTERQAAGAAVVPRPLNLLLFPNPAHEVLQCVFTSTYGGAGMVFVRDLAGKVVMRQDVAVMAGENSIALAVGALAPGLYILELAEADEAAREKFMVQ